jgi:hypothetical protein
VAERAGFSPVAAHHCGATRYVVYKVLGSGER